MSHRTRFLSAWIAAAAATAALSVLAAGPASAATYRVYSCRDAEGDPVATMAWRAGDGPAAVYTDTCDTGGALSALLTSAATAEGTTAGYRFAVPPGTSIQRYRVWLSAATDAMTPSGAYAAGVGTFGELAPAVVEHGCPVLAGPTCTFGDPGDPSGAANLVDDTPNAPQLALLAACPPGAGACTPAGPQPARVDLYRSEVEFDDSAFPTVGAVAGTIRDGVRVSGVRSVRGEAADVGAGVRRVQLLVDGVVVDEQTAGGRCRTPYVVADPCPETLHAAFDLDTRTLAEGLHDVALRAVDAAGNATTGPAYPFIVDQASGRPAVIVVPGPARPAPAPETPAATPAEPERRPQEDAPAARRRVQLPGRVSLPATRPVTGRVVDAGGRPAAGVAITFERRPLGGDDDAWRPLSARRTSGPDGRFDVPVPGDSAEVRATAGGDRDAAATVRFVRALTVSASASRRTLRNGDTLTLRGRFAHAGGALEGRPVLIQARVRGTWRTVDSAEADAAGRVRWDYRFTNTTRTARYVFRLVLPRTKELPWGRVTSDPVEVLVHPAR
jgi:hypothetical protein